MTIAQRIRNILEAVPQTRNDDKLLWIVYAQKYGLDLTPKQVEKIKTMPSWETLRRTRQMIQKSGAYQADPRIKAARDVKAFAMRKGIPWMEETDVERTIDGNVIMPWGK